MRVSIAAKNFADRQVLRAVDFALGDGEVLAVVGRSGAGKTTLLRLIAGLDTAFEGTIDVAGPVGMVFQEPRLLPWRRALDNVALALPGSPSPAGSAPGGCRGACRRWGSGGARHLPARSVGPAWHAAWRWRGPWSSGRG